MAVLSVPKTDLYKFIREALIHKRYNRAAQDYRYRGIPIRYEPTIFDEARRIFKKRGLINYLKNDQILIDRFVDQVDNDPSLGIFKQPETALAKENPLQLEQEHTAWERTVQAEQQIYQVPSHTPSQQTPISHGPSISTILSSAKEAPVTGATVPETTIPGGITKAFENEPEYVLNPDIQPPPKSPKTQVPPEHVLNPAITRPLTSRAGVFLQRNVGKYFTVGRVGTGISMGIGAIAGSILGPAGTFAGAGVGALMPSFIRSGGGRFLGNIGNGAINAGLGISNQISTGSLIKLPPKKFWAFIGLFFLLIGVGIFSAVFTPPGEEQPAAEAAPVAGPTYTGEGAGTISCPLNSPARTTNGSKEAGGHCTPSYEASYGVCTKPGSTGYTGRDTAIDVTSDDRFVYLPRIQGEVGKKWIVDEAGNVPITEGEGGGISVAAYTTANNKTYRIRFVHIQSTDLKIGDVVEAGTAVGQYYLNNPYGAHVHITLQEDGFFKPADSYFNLCK